MPKDYSIYSQAGAIDPATGEMVLSVEGIEDTEYPTLGVSFDESSAPLEPHRDQEVNDLVTKGLAGVPIALIDTIGQSVGLFDDKTISDGLKNIGLTEFGSYYDTNKEALELASAIPGVFIPGMVGIKALRSVQGLRASGALGNTLKNSTSAEALIGGATQYTKRLDEIKRITTKLQNSRGTLAGGNFKIDRLGEVSLSKARKDAIATKIADGMREGIAAELAIYGLMNESNTLFPDEFSTADNLAWAALGVALPAALEGAFARKQVRDTIKSIAKGAGPALSGQGLSADFLKTTTFRPQMRGVGISLFAESRAATEEALKSIGDDLLISNLNNDILGYDEVLLTQLKNLGGDTNISMGKSYKLSDKQAHHLLENLKEDSYGFLNAVKFDEVAHSFDEFSERLTKRLDVRQGKLQDQIDAFIADDPLAHSKKIDELQKQINEINRFRKAEYTVAENNGDITLYATRPEKWLDSHSFKEIKTRTEAAGKTHTLDMGQEGFLGLDDAFNTIVPQPRTQTPVENRANYVQQVTARSEKASGQVADIITRAFAPGENMGREYLAKMKPQSAAVMRDWTAGGMRRLRAIEASGDKDGVLQDIYDSASEIREALRELQYSQTYGTIPLYRGESKTASKPGQGPKSDLASFTTDVKVARAFAEKNGGSVIRKDVLIDDIVGVAGLPGEREFIVRNNRTRRYSVGTPGIAEVGLDSISYTRMSALQAMASREIGKYKAGKPASTKTQSISKGSSWFTLEAQLESLRVSRDKGTFFKLGKGFRSEEDVEFDILAGKFEMFNKLMDKREQTAAIPALADRAVTREEIIDMLNLPHDVPGGTQAPIVDFFFELRAQGDRDLRVALTNSTDKNVISAQGKRHPLDLVRAAMHASVEFPNAPVEQRYFKLRGNQLKQDEIDPVLVQNLGAPVDSHTQRELINVAAIQRSQQLQAISEAGQKGHLVIAASAESMMGTSLFDQARKVDELAPEGVLSGSGIFVQQGRIEDQDPVLKALSDLVQFSERASKPVIEAYMAPVIDNLTKLRSQSGRQGLIDFNRVEQSYRYGWDIAEVVEAEGKQGRFNFLLQDTNRNRTLWAKLFPDKDYPLDVDRPAFMPGMTKTELDRGYVPLEVEEIAAETAMQISQISRRIGEEVNFMRQKQGIRPIKLRDFHLPTPELNKENMWVVYNERGKVITTFSGATPEAGRIEAERFIKERTDKGERHLRVHSWQEVQRYHGVHSDDFQQFIDYSDEINQTGKAASGNLFSSVVDSTDATLNNITATLSDNLTSLAARSRAMLFEPQINHARLMHQASGSKSNELTIWERYVNIIYGGQTQTPRTAVGSVYRTVESVFDNFLVSQYDNFNSTFGRSGKGESSADAAKGLLNYDAREYARYKQQAGDQDIFGDFEKYLRDTHKVTTPPSLRKILLNSNQVAGTLMYRFLDAGSAILNLSSVMTNAAPVMRAISRGKDETFDAWRQRTGAYSSQVSSDYRTFNPMKAMVTTMHKWQTPEFQQVLKDAEKMGMFQPEFIAMNKILNEPMENMAASQLRRFTDAASWLADNSETMSRKMSWALGYNIATDMLKIENRKDAMLFALRFENDMIGDYRPQNRPQIFQGAIGLPLGMFMTYMFNFYRRMYGYLERRDLSAIGAQYATQASIFGLSSTPGWEQFSEFFYSNYDGTHNPVDQIQTNFDEDFADLILYGSMSSIPKIFGMDGLSLYTRGNANFSAPPTPFTPERSPVWGFATQIAEGSRKAVDQFLKGGEFTPRQTMEILGAFSVNRPIQGLIELGLGYEVDRRGAVIDENTRDMMGIVSRMLGTNELSVQKQKEAMYRIRSTDLVQRGIRGRMRESVRALVRDGKLDADDLRSLVQNYIDSGGDPQYFGSWLRDNALAAKSSKANLLLKDLVSGKDYTNMVRLLAVMQPELSENGD